MTNELITSLLTANLAGAAAIVAVLAMRRPVRDLLGAGPAYGLWLLPLAAMAASVLPQRTHIVQATMQLSPEATSAATPIAEAHLGSLPAPGSAQVLPGFENVLLFVWLVGVAASLALLFLAQRRAMARFGALKADAFDRRLVRTAALGVGPALLGVIRPRIVLPADFERRFEPGERELVLAHERAHLAAGHPFINALAAAIVAANWFNPFVHIAARYARIDQELACDAAVIARHPTSRQAYARALMKAQPMPISPLVCAWPGGSKGLLEARLLVLSRARASRARLAWGVGAVVALTLGAGLTAWAVQPPRVLVETSAPAGPASLAAGAPVPAQPDATLEPEAMQIVLPTQISLTNAGGQAARFARNEAAVRAAIAALNTGDLIRAGGSAAEVADVLRRLCDQEGQPECGSLPKAGTERWITGPDGYLMLGGTPQAPTEGQFSAVRNLDMVNLTAPPGVVPASFEDSMLSTLEGLPDEVLEQIRTAMAESRAEPDVTGVTTAAEAISRGAYGLAAQLGATSADIVRAEQAQGQMSGMDPANTTVIIGPSGNVRMAISSPSSNGGGSAPPPGLTRPGDILLPPAP